jgi:hypothetical protein
MSTPLFKRDYVLYVRKAKNDTENTVLEIRNLRCSFKIKKTTELTPNTAEIKIYNLSDETRRKLKTKGGYIHFEAGYEGALTQTYQGNIREIDHTREGTEWVTTFYSSDGLVPLQVPQCNQTFPPDTSKAEAAKQIASYMQTSGLSVDPAQLEAIEGSLPNGMAVSGNAAKNMTKLVEGAGYSWSIQDGKLQIRKKGQAAKGKTLLISPDSGLVGSPSHVTPNSNNTKKVAHVKAQCLLFGNIVCGCKIAVQSENINGVFLVDSVEHHGDTWGQDWYTEVEGVALPEQIA